MYRSENVKHNFYYLEISLTKIKINGSSICYTSKTSNEWGYWRNKKHFNNVNRIGKRRIRLQHGILADCYAQQKEENFCDQSRKLFILTALGFYCFYPLRNRT